ncbi:hypothetical protein BFJ70_g6384 [Fusarium oxysporum]|nr:hypothetical protein BFJ70_g6384 [Fusarium oxysporum]
MDAEWQYNLLDEDMSLIMDLNDPFGSIPSEIDLSLVDSYQLADDTALTMGDPLLGRAIACDEYLPDGAYPDFLADVTSRTDNSSFPNTDCPTTFDELIVSDVLVAIFATFSDPRCATCASRDIHTHESWKSI